MKSSIKLLVVTPNTALLGGVANHYRGLRKYFDSSVYYHIIAHRGDNIFKKIFSYVSFSTLIIREKPNVILLNPSFQNRALLRDFGFLLIAKSFKKDVVVFFHGWDKKLEKKIRINSIWKSLFLLPDGYIVLASEYRGFLEGLNLRKPIYIETTKVDDDYISDFSIATKQYTGKLLVMSRIVESKGVLLAIEILKELTDSGVNVILDIVGEGPLLPQVKSKVLEMELQEKVNFHGYLTGNSLKTVINNNSVLLLPTTHGEGLPTSIVEAMGMGLVIVTSSVGGIKDLYEKVDFGLSEESNSIREYTRYLRRLFHSSIEMSEIGLRNHEYVKSNMVASVVAQRLMLTIERIKEKRC